MYSFNVESAPVPKARARATIRNGKIWHYTPKATADFEQIVRLTAIKAGVKPIEGPVGMAIVFQFKKQEVKPGEWHTRKPDLTNLAKSVEDALNGVAYKDDSQIVELLVEKEFGKKNVVFVQIWEKKDRKDLINRINY